MKLLYCCAAAAQFAMMVLALTRKEGGFALSSFGGFCFALVLALSPA